jgi:hypothetical protein
MMLQTTGAGPELQNTGEAEPGDSSLCSHTGLSTTIKYLGHR